MEGASVQAAGKQKALNIKDLSLSVGQSQKLKVLNGKRSGGALLKNSGKRQQKGVVKAKKRKGSDYGKGREVETESKDNRKSKKKKTIRPEIIRMKPNSRPKQKNRW